MSECVVRMDMPENCAVCPFVTEYSRCVFLGMYAIDEERRADKCPIICQLPEGHGPLVDFNDVSKELRKYGYIVKDEITGMQYMEYPIVLEQNPIRIHTIVPAEAESQSPKPTDPVPIRDVYYVMTECDAKTGTVKYEPRERIEL